MDTARKVPEVTSVGHPTADQIISSAVHRADYMEEVSLQLAGSLNVRRTMARLVDLATPKLGDWALLALFDGNSATAVTRHRAGKPSSPQVIALPAGAPGLDRIRRTGRPELARIPVESSSLEALAELIPDEEMRHEAAAFSPADVLGVGLNARGTTIGALIVVRGENREYDDLNINLVDEFARRAAVTLDSARLYEDRAHVAAVLQASLRPPSLPEVPGIRAAARYRAAADHTDIGGDFYDIHGSSNDWSLVLGDVCGKGVDAAVLHGKTRQAVRTAAYFDRSPSVILTVLNEVLLEDDTDLFVTLACARLQPDPATGTAKLTLAIAGHPAPMILRADGTVEQPQVGGALSGVIPEQRYQEITISLQTGDLFLLYTDGIYEAKGPNGFFGMDRLRDLLSAHAGAEPDTVCEAIEQSVLNHLDGRPHDDMALLAIRCEKATG